MRSTRSRQMVLEASPLVQPIDTVPMQGDAGEGPQNELCAAPLGEPCEPGAESYDWEQVLTF